MATVEFKAHLNDDGSIAEHGFKNIIFDRYEMPDRPGALVSAADKFANERLMLMSQEFAGEVFYSASIFVNGEYVCALRQLTFVSTRAYRFMKVPVRFRTVRELKRCFDPDIFDFCFIEADGSVIHGDVSLDTVYDSFSFTDYDDQRVVFVYLPEPEHSLAETMQNFAEL